MIVENYSPRVMDQWGMDTDTLLAANPDLVVVRAPAFGLSGPWRERVGYAQTIEMTVGLAWLTGTSDGRPEIPNGPCDPIAGLHATIAVLLGLEHRRRSGRGLQVEIPMVGGALNLAAEQVIEWTANGVLLERDGNRSPNAAPQGAYRTSDDDLPFDQGRWVMISVTDDAQWKGLCRAVTTVDWADDPGLATLAGRRAAHDRLDADLASWCATRRAVDIVAALIAAGVPAATVMVPQDQALLEPLSARQFFTVVEHPIVGPARHAGFPAVFALGPDPAALHISPPPLLGQHSREILTDILGLDDDDLVQLEADGVIGNQARATGTAW